jgi:hypothetical protein
VFLVNSRFPLASATTPSSQGHALSPGVVPLLPKLRGHFAEFLDHSSPERLGILYQTTCVGLGYGPTRPSLEAFLDSIGSTASPLRAPHHASGLCNADLPTLRPTRLARDNHRPGPPTFLRHPIARLLPAQITDPTPRSPKAVGVRGGLSITGLGPCGTRRVREYQPVVHRLRLSASP